MILDFEISLISVNSLPNKKLVLVPWKLREQSDIFGNVYRGGGVRDWKTAAELWMGMFDFTEIFPFICDPILKGMMAIGVKYLIKGFPRQKAECISSVLISFRWLNQQITGLIVDQSIKNLLSTQFVLLLNGAAILLESQVRLRNMCLCIEMTS